jgi:hypothetical protein
VNFAFTFNDNETTDVLTEQSTISAPALNFNDTFKFTATTSGSAGGSTTTTVTLNYDVTDATDAVTAQGTITSVQPASGPATTSGTITVSVNGQQFATITASNTGETYTATNGSLTTAQAQALEAMFANGIALEVIVLLLIIPFAIA